MAGSSPAPSARPGLGTVTLCESSRLQAARQSEHTGRRGHSRGGLLGEEGFIDSNECGDPWKADWGQGEKMGCFTRYERWRWAERTSESSRLGRKEAPEGSDSRGRRTLTSPGRDRRLEAGGVREKGPQCGRRLRATPTPPQLGLPARKKQPDQAMNGLANWPFCFLCIFISKIK